MLSRKFLIGLSFALTANTASASLWEIDASHSSANFAVRHLMVSNVRGTLGKVTGTVELDEGNLAASTVNASIDVNGIDTNDAKRDEHLKAPDFLDAAKYPAVTFKSKSVAKVSDTKFNVVGDLTLHGVTKEVTLEVEGSPIPMTDPWGNQKLGGVAKTKINRQDFGIAFNKTLDNGGLVVGNDVEVTIDIELTKKK